MEQQHHDLMEEWQLKAANNQSLLERKIFVLPALLVETPEAKPLLTQHIKKTKNVKQIKEYLVIFNATRRKPASFKNVLKELSMEDEIERRIDVMDARDYFEDFNKVITELEGDYVMWSNAIWRKLKKNVKALRKKDFIDPAKNWKTICELLSVEHKCGAYEYLEKKSLRSCNTCRNNTNYCVFHWKSVKAEKAFVNLNLFLFLVVYSFFFYIIIPTHSSQRWKFAEMLTEFSTKLCL